MVARLPIPTARRFGALAGALALLLSAAPATAQSPDSRNELLVDASWLMDNLDRDDLVLLHVARNEEALAGLETVPGAAALHLGQISYNRMEEGEPHVMLDLPEDLSGVREAFEAAGVSDESRVVVLYDGGAFPNASRTVWTLQVLGRDEGVSILDGGLEAWVAAGGEVTAPSTPAPGSLTLPTALDRRVDARWVLDHGQDAGIALVDARRTVSWDGTRPELPGRVGHIPGAGSLPQTELYDDQGRLKPAGELRSLFEAAGFQEGDQVVAYCHIGYWASAVVFAARTLGWDARLYDGSMTEWAADDELPLVVPR
ncbi:MAG TPA: rhodanese-like domain-containing protein [Longimicrobiales bacterium]|nr:rhodanese-like domain-containing protein [Longimicrobiales bacterium]